MKTIYCATDGRQFEKEEDCKQYEVKIEQAKAAQASKMRQEKEDWQEVEDAYEQYREKYISYAKKYNSSTISFFSPWDW
jgi:hypothetical protein